MAKLDVNTVTIANLVNNYIVQKDESVSGGAYNNSGNLLIAITENTALETGDYTKVYDAVLIPWEKATGTVATDVKVGTTMVRVMDSATTTKKVMQVSIGTDVNNTYNVPTFNDGKVFKAIDTIHFTGNDYAKLILGGIKESINSLFAITPYDVSLDMINGAELLDNVVAPTPSKVVASGPVGAKVSEVSEEPKETVEKAK